MSGLMSGILRYFVAFKPGWAFAGFYFTFFVGVLLGAGRSIVFNGIFSWVGGTIFLGCPIVILMGLPRQYVSRGILRLSVACAICDCLLSAATFATTIMPNLVIASGIVAQLLGSMFVLGAFLPFFLATHVVDEASRVAGIYKPLDCYVAVRTRHIIVTSGGSLPSRPILSSRYLAELAADACEFRERDLAELLGPFVALTLRVRQKSVKTAPTVSVRLLTQTRKARLEPNLS